MIKNIGIGWQLHDRTGWGVYGINLTLQLLARSDYTPTLLFPTGAMPANPLTKNLLHPLVENYHSLANSLARLPKYTPPTSNLLLLYGLGNNFHFNKSPVNSADKAGIIFFENTNFDQAGKERAQQFPLIITGSHWNEEVLQREKLSAKIETVIQGIDPTIFHPAPKAGLFKDRFVIFSGGKLEYRKGQDIVIAAFRIFQKRHPEALLLAAWHNSWPESMAEIATQNYVSGTPATDGDQQQAITSWLLKNNLPQASFLVIPETPNIYMASIMREADVALFPNRGEGGTNLVAMEALACGIPTILAANTGQLDFADPKISIPLKIQTNVKPTTSMTGVAGWGESNIDEVVEALEEIYNRPEEAQIRADRAAELMRNFSWSQQIGKLLTLLEDFFK